jgi:LysM repeat protein
MKRPFQTLSLILILFALILPAKAAQARPSNLPRFQEASPTPEADTATPEPAIPSPADIINAVNNLRLANGLNVLSVHPVLMEVAAQQASALALSEGAVGHERPCGMTLGQQLLVLGFPLWGDLSMDGYRSENWVMAGTVEQVMAFWQSDEEHNNTMVSDFRSDIGAAIAVSDQIYVVLETALSTPSRQHQNTAYAILTGIPATQTLCAGFASGDISDYLISVAVNTARPDGDVVHEVQYGQTLWSLSDLYHVSVEDIKRLNGLVDDTVVPGWKLLIQKAATQPAPPTATFILNTPNQTQVTFATLTLTATPIYTSIPNDTDELVQSLRQNKFVIVALIISFSVLVAGVVGFGKKRE